MATSGEFKFLTLGLLLVVVGLTSVATAKCEESALEETDSLPAFPETTLEQSFWRKIRHGIKKIAQRGYVYLIEEDNPGAREINFKIGHAFRKQACFGYWQTDRPQTLTLNSVRVRDRFACEKHLKNAFSGYRSTGTELYTTSRDQAEDVRGLFTRTVQEQCQ